MGRNTLSKRFNLIFQTKFDVNLLDKHLSCVYRRRARWHAATSERSNSHPSPKRQTPSNYYYYSERKYCNIRNLWVHMRRLQKRRLHCILSDSPDQHLLHVVVVVECVYLHFFFSSVSSDGCSSPITMHQFDVWCLEFGAD